MLGLSNNYFYTIVVIIVLSIVYLGLQSKYPQLTENFAEKHHHAHHKHHAHHAASPKVEAKPEIPVGPQDTTVTGHLQLPNDFMLSADVDGWLRTKTHDGQKYKNMAADLIYANSGVQSQGCDFVLGGNCSRGDSGPSRALVKDQGPQLVINYANDFKQGTRIDGDFYLNNNKLHFDNYNNDNSDPYYLQKIVTGGDQSSLRLTLNDNADESFQIWGNSCGEAGGCGGAGAMKHQFVTNGDAIHTGNLTVKGSKINSMIDNRARDDPPKWYRGQGVGEYTEFKGAPWAGIGGYSYVKTIVPWPDTSGGTVKQIAYSDDGVRIRKSSDGSENGWTAWRWIGPM
jgi:hypothetical protein